MPWLLIRFGDGWWRGRNLASGARGVFPSNYVEAAAMATLFSARALYSCDGDGPGELTFSAGETIDVTATDVPTQGEGWWVGALGSGAAGMFPSNYVERIGPAGPGARSGGGGGGARKNARGKVATTETRSLFSKLIGGKKKAKVDASADFEIGGFSNVSVRHVDLGGAGAARRKTASGPPSLVPRHKKSTASGKRASTAKKFAAASSGKETDADADAELAAMAREQARLEAVAEQRRAERKKVNAAKLEAKRVSLERARNAAAEAEAVADAETAKELAAMEREEARLAAKVSSKGAGKKTKKKKAAKKKGKKIASKGESSDEIDTVDGAAVYVAIDNFDVRLRCRVAVSLLLLSVSRESGQRAYL